MIISRASTASTMEYENRCMIKLAKLTSFKYHKYLKKKNCDFSELIFKYFSGSTMKLC